MAPLVNFQPIYNKSRHYSLAVDPQHQGVKILKK